MDAPVSQLSSPLPGEGRTVELLGVGGFWTCQTVLLGVVGVKDGGGGERPYLEGSGSSSTARNYGKKEERAGLLISACRDV